MSWHYDRVTSFLGWTSCLGKRLSMKVVSLSGSALMVRRGTGVLRGWCGELCIGTPPPRLVPVVGSVNAVITVPHDGVRSYFLAEYQLFSTAYVGAGLYCRRVCVRVLCFRRVDLVAAPAAAVET